MIKKYSLKILQAAINTTLSLDETTITKIKELEGKTLEIIIIPLNVNFFISFENNQLILLDNYATVTDAIITSSPLGLIRLSLLPPSKTRSLFNDQIKFSGDILFAQKVKQLFDELDIDWEGHLARFTGDVVAFQVGSFIKQGLARTTQFSKSLQNNITEYLQEEYRLFPSREEVNDFFNDIHQLVLDVDRLEANILTFLK